MMDRYEVIPDDVHAAAWHGEEEILGYPVDVRRNLRGDPVRGILRPEGADSVHAQMGDYVMIHADGSVEALDHYVFFERYRPVADAP